MIRFNRNSREAVPTIRSTQREDLGTSYRQRNEDTGQRQATASVSSQNTSVSQMPVEIDIDPLLKNIIFSEDLEQKKLVTRLYRDIYYNDAIGGSAVDLVSVLPFSDITLGGITDDNAEAMFMDTMERLRVRTLMPAMAADHLVDGTSLGSLIPNRDSTKIVDYMPHRSDNAKVDSMPFFSQDPIINVAIEESMRNTINSGGKRVEQLKERLNPEILDLLNQGAIELDPLTCVYVPRKVFTVGEGVSWFRRILPMYLLEKNLFRGTLVESARRQRGILHITLDGNDNWVPMRQDMEFVSDLFMNADADPLGAIIATRAGVSTEEIRQGGDFWKVTDIWDTTAQFKMRSLGLNESFLSGEQNFATADSSMTVFLEWLRAFREMMTQRIFYNKIFPLISMMNGYTVNRRGKFIKRGPLLSDNTQRNLELLGDSRLLIPTVHWAKQLKPEGDSTYLDILKTMTESGVPIPLRALAAAGGFNLDALLADSHDDLRMLKRISEYNKEVSTIKAKYGPKVEEGGDTAAFASASSEMRAALNQLNNGKSAVHNQGIGRPISLKSRDFGEKSEVVDRTRTGKKKMVHNQALANSRANDRILRAAQEIDLNRGASKRTSVYVSKRGPVNAST